ncbi:MAG: GNAT family N-acetyltransferase [Bacteroidota bacterium]
MPIRSTVPEDRDEIKNILHRTETFSEREIEIALEVFDIHFEDPEEDYELYTCVDEKNKVLGYVCTGPTPLTEGTWDIYWIAVRSDAQGKGVGKQLADFLEDRVRSARGRLVVAETSSSETYGRARRFYVKHGYHELATILDYYRPGDHLIIYGKYL